MKKKICAVLAVSCCMLQAAHVPPIQFSVFNSNSLTHKAATLQHMPPPPVPVPAVASARIPAGSSAEAAQPTRVPSCTTESSLLSWLTFIPQHIASHKVIAGIVATCLGLYGITWLRLLYAAHYLPDLGSWSMWKEHIPVEIMLQIPHQEVAEELFAAIRQAYPPAHAHDIMTPLVTFNYAVDQELKQLYGFLHIHELIDKVKASLLFPAHEELLRATEIKIKRLLYLRDILVGWMSDQSNNMIHDRIVTRSCIQKP